MRSGGAEERRSGGAGQLAHLAGLGVDTFDAHVARAGLPTLTATDPTVLQINVGKLCNQRCHHCHVDAGPDRTDAMMDEATADACIAAMHHLRPRTVDLTGGAPELNPQFRRLVVAAHAAGVEEIIDRCNLTVLLLDSQRDLLDFLVRHRVRVVASLPAINAAQTDSQRGNGVFDRSITALRRLNAVGYGTALHLTLMSNPTGAFLPAPQGEAEARFRRLLRSRWQIEFTDLIELTNMPISRFLDFLRASNNDQAYVHKLSAAFNPDAVAGLMCRNTLSVGWDGKVFDCDFNQQLDLPLNGPTTIHDVNRAALTGRTIVTGTHCLGCTAGQGSSCGGATAG